VLEDLSARGWMGEIFVIDGVAHFWRQVVQRIR
jgi:hypothetical protein